MKKSLFTVVVLISILSLLLATAAAPRAKSNSLDSTKYTPGKGVVLIFSVADKFSKADLMGASLFVNHNSYSLHCHEKDGNKVICEAPGQVNQFHGYKATAMFAGQYFKTTIPNVTHVHTK